MTFEVTPKLPKFDCWISIFSQNNTAFEYKKHSLFIMVPMMAP